MEALRTPRYRIVLATSAANQIAVWTAYTAAIAGMLAAGMGVVELGLLSACWTLGMPIPVIAGGALTDRFGPSRVLLLGIAVQVGGILLMTLAFSGPAPALAPILLAAALIGGAEGFNSVSIQVLAGAVVPRSQMGSAIGSLLIATATGRIAGGLLIGPLVALVGIAPSFIVSLLFPATAVLLLRRLGRVAAIADEGAPAGSRLDLRPGARWLRSSPVAISVVLIGALMSLAVYSYFAPLPIVVARTLGSDAGAQGVAMALGGVAILAIGLSLGRILRRFGTGRVLIAGVFASAFFVAGLGLAESAAVAVVVLTLLPMCTNIQYATCNLLLQQLAPAAVRGRVLGLFTLTFVLLEPIGMAGVSALSQVAGEQIVLVGMGIVTTLSVGLIVLLRPAILRAGAAAPA